IRAWPKASGAAIATHARRRASGSGAFLDQRYGLLTKVRIRVHGLHDAAALIRRPAVLGDLVERVLLQLVLRLLSLFLRLRLRELLLVLAQRLLELDVDVRERLELLVGNLRNSLRRSGIRRGRLSRLS